MENYDKQIKEYENKIQDLKEKKAADEAKAKVKRFPDAEKLAELLHSKLCHWNHIDGCGWDYESWEKPGYAREEYLEKANKILKIVDLNTALKCIKLI